jgi:hypothetical protein
MGGKKKVQAGRMSVNRQPIMPISIGKRVTAHDDHNLVLFVRPIIRPDAHIVTIGPGYLT